MPSEPVRDEVLRKIATVHEPIVQDGCGHATIAFLALRGENLGCTLHDLAQALLDARALLSDADFELGALIEWIDQRTGGDDTTKGAKKVLVNIMARPPR